MSVHTTDDDGIFAFVDDGTYNNGNIYDNYGNAAAFISKCTTILSASSFSMTFLSGVAAALAFCL